MYRHAGDGSTIVELYNCGTIWCDICYVASPSAPRYRLVAFNCCSYFLISFRPQSSSWSSACVCPPPQVLLSVSTNTSPQLWNVPATALQGHLLDSHWLATCSWNLNYWSTQRASCARKIHIRHLRQLCYLKKDRLMTIERTCYCVICGVRHLGSSVLCTIPRKTSAVKWANCIQCVWRTLTE